MMPLSTIAREMLPPMVIRLLQKLRGGNIRFHGRYATWDEATADSQGYSEENILAKVLAATLKVKSGEAAFERDSVAFPDIEYSWPVLTGLMWAAARNHGRLNVLDFGGALGSSYFQHKKFLDLLPGVCWNVVEQAHYVQCGKKYIQNETLRFYPTISDCLAENAPNAILVSSVLQYLDAPSRLLAELLDMAADVLILDRTIVNDSAEDRIYVQKVPPSIYRASYPCRSFSESRLIELIGRRYETVAHFQSLDFPALKTVDSAFKGFVFHRKSSGA